MNKIIMLILASTTSAVLANQPPTTNKVQVFSIPGSDVSLSEKWVDENTGVVCYIVKGQSNDSAPAINCIKFK